MWMGGSISGSPFTETLGVRMAEHPALVVMPRCKCGKWATYLGNYDEDGYTIRCKGCLRAIWKCRC
jgi:hypothetical protein